MVAVILAHEECRQPGYDHVWARKANNAYQVFQTCAMMPASQRLPHVLGGGVPSIQEPHILDPQLGESMAQFHLSRSPERLSPFGSHVIVSSLTARHINGGHLLTLIQQLNQVSRSPGLIVRMSHNQQHIGSETIVGPGRGLHNILRNYRNR